MSDYPRVFISYSRQDGEIHASEIRDILVDRGISCWQDRTDMEGGRNWWKQITDALEHVAYMVLIATPGAMNSDIVRREWQYARQHGVCIYPVIVPELPLDFTMLPNWMRKAHFYDLANEWEKFVSHLQRDCTANRVPFMAPEKPETYIERFVQVHDLLELFLDDLHENPKPRQVALRGAGGFGKTTIATGLCHDDRIITAYDEGVLWVTLGEAPDILTELTKLYRAISGDIETNFIDIGEASQALAERLEDYDYIIVIDDVWDISHLRPFLRGGDRCSRLITTRNFDVAAQMDIQVVIDQMEDQESVQLLTAKLDVENLDTTIFNPLAVRLGAHPLMLELVGEALRKRIERGDSIDGALKWVQKALDRHGMKAFDSKNPEQRHQAISRTIDVSMDLLTESEQSQYLELAIFADDTDIPLSAAQALWGWDEFDTETLIQQLFDLSLLKFDLQNGEFRLHDIIRTYLLDRLQDAEQVHQKLVDGWQDLYDLPDVFAWRWLSYHLIHANNTDKLYELLVDFDWLLNKLEATDPNTLLVDFDRFKNAQEDEDIALIQSAIRNAAHVISADTSQLSAQLIGRLGAIETDTIQNLLDDARMYCSAPWLEPLTPSLPRAGGPMMLTIKGHEGTVSNVRLADDIDALVSTSSDGTVRFWNWQTGGETFAIEPHGGAKVNDVAVSKTGKWFASAGSDHDVVIYDMEKKSSRILKGHQRIVSSILITPDEEKIISASSDETIRVWSVKDGELLKVLDVHDSLVSEMIVAPNGTFFASGSADETVIVWNLETLEPILTLQNHTYVETVTISRDSSTIFVGCADGCVVMWNAETGEQVSKWQAHDKSIESLVLDADTDCLITASADLTIRGWDCNTNEQRFQLEGHMFPLTSLALSRDGKVLISASADHTIKIWQLENIFIEDETDKHQSRINSLALTSDEKFVLSAASDDTIKVWQLADKTLYKTLEGHLKRVNSVSVVPKGRFGVSGASDGMLKVWDVVSGLETHSFKAHSKDINTVVISPDGKRIISGSSDSTLKMWNMASEVALKSFEGHNMSVQCVTISKDGRKMVSTASNYYGREFDLCYWDLENNELLAKFTGHKRRINDLAISPDGSKLVTASDDYTLIIWDLETQTPIITLDKHTERVNTVAITDDGQFIISGGDDGRLIMWYLDTGEIYATYSADDALFASVVSSDGQRIITAGSSRKLHFLNLHTCDE